MIICKQEILNAYNKGLRIACVGHDFDSQALAIAKHIVSKQIGKQVKEMDAYQLPDGNVVVGPKNPSKIKPYEWI